MSAMSDHPINAPVCHIDFYGTEAIKKPIAAYEEMLRAGPVVWLESNKRYAICGHAAVTAALRNFKNFSSAKGVSIDDATNG